MIYAISGILTVAVYIAFLPIVTILVGHTNANSSILVCASLFAFTIGVYAHQKNIHLPRWSLGICSALMVLIGVFFESVTMAAAENLILVSGVFVTLIATSVLLGIFTSQACFSSSNFSLNYALVNLCILISIVLVLFLKERLGLNFIFILIGLVSVALSFMSKKVKAKVLKLPDRRELITDLLLGFIASAYVCTFFHQSYLFLFPIGIEFITYLFTSIFFIFLAAETARRYKLSADKNLSLFVTLGTLSYLLLFQLLHYESPSRNIGRSLKDMFITSSLNWELNVIYIVLFLVPYFFFCFLLPIRQQQSGDKNHLLFFSIGNVLAFVVVGYASMDTPLKLKMLLIPLLTIASLKLINKRFRTFSFLGATIVGVVSLPLLGENISERLLRQSFQYQNHLWRGLSDFKHFNTDLSNIQISGTTQIDGYVGYTVTTKRSNVSRLGLGAYSSSLHNLTDQIENEFIKSIELSEAPKKMLLIGLGNLSNLEAMLRWRPPNSMSDHKVISVDNFSPFEEKAFIDHLRNIPIPLQERWDHHNQDGFAYVLRNSNDLFEEFSLIALNLTSPDYVGSSHLFTTEFLVTMKGLLKENGVVISPIPRGELRLPLFCMHRRLFPHSRVIKKEGAFIFVGVKNHKAKSNQEFVDCDTQDIPTIAKMISPIDNIRRFNHLKKTTLRKE